MVIGKFRGDTIKFRQALAERPGEFAAISDRAKAAGGISEDFVLIIDEWDTVDSFQKFFSDPGLQEFIGSVGADPAPPEITISEAISSPDQY